MKFKHKYKKDTLPSKIAFVFDSLITFIGFALSVYFAIRLASGGDVVVAVFGIWAGTWLIRSRGLFTHEVASVSS